MDERRRRKIKKAKSKKISTWKSSMEDRTEEEDRQINAWEPSAGDRTSEKIRGMTTREARSRKSISRKIDDVNTWEPRSGIPGSKEFNEINTWAVRGGTPGSEELNEINTWAVRGGTPGSEELNEINTWAARGGTPGSEELNEINTWAARGGMPGSEELNEINTWAVRGGTPGSEELNEINTWAVRGGIHSSEEIGAIDSWEAHTGLSASGAASEINSWETAAGTRISREERMKRRRRQVRHQKIILGMLLIVAAMGIGIGLRGSLPSGLFRKNYGNVQKPDIDVQLLTINEYSRPGYATNTITGVVVHYTGNPGTTAQQNHDYFENLKDSHLTYASSNFIIGLEGEIIQCVPTSEVAYASNTRNYDTISIECCHPDETGKFTNATYESLVKLTAWLCSEFGLSEDDVIRHYDVTGKYCPLYFVEHEDAWSLFKEDVGGVLKRG